MAIELLHSGNPNEPSAPWSQESWVTWTAQMLDSYHKWTGRQLIHRIPSNELPSDTADTLRAVQLTESQKLFEAPFVVVSHGTEADPLLNYGNQTALELWEMSLSQLIGTPSRRTAEPVHREERAMLLQRTRDFGFIDDYSGIRISATGRRFRIHQATVWNIVDSTGNHVGQAAAFSSWTFLQPDQS